MPSRRAKAKKAMAPYRMQPTDAKGKGVAPAESGVKRERPTEVIDLLDSSDEEEPVGGTMPSGCVGASTSGVKKGPDSWNYPNLLPELESGTCRLARPALLPELESTHGRERL